MTIQIDPPRSRRSRRALDALFREARRLERQRRLRSALLVLVVGSAVAAVAYVAVEAGGGPSRRGGQSSSGAALGGVSVVPKDPFTLGVSPSGVLYVADRGRQEILGRLPSGRFEVAAGTGVAGDSGDGGPAGRAEVDDPSSMAVAPSGALYFVQQGRGIYHVPSISAVPSVVREIAPDGTVRTVVGAHPNCRAVSSTSRSIPAEDAVMFDNALAFGPGGELYLSGVVCPNVLNLGPLLELTKGGVLVAATLNPIVAKAFNCYGSGFAFSPSGSVYVACDSGGGHPKELLIVEPSGTTKAFRYVFPYDDPSGLTTAPDGTVIAIDYLEVVSVTPQGVRTIINLGYDSHHSFLGRFRGIPGSMEPNGIAVDRQGDIFLAATSGLGNGTFTGIIEIHTDGRGVQVLWSRPSR